MLEPPEARCDLGLGSEVSSKSRFRTGPDSDADCRCLSGLYCYEKGESRCTYSFTERYGSKSIVFFLLNLDVECK